MHSRHSGSTCISPVLPKSINPLRFRYNNKPKIYQRGNNTREEEVISDRKTQLPFFYLSSVSRVEGSLGQSPLKELGSINLFDP